MNDEPESAETPMEKFENLAKRVFSVKKDDVAKPEEATEEVCGDTATSEEPEPDES